MEIISSFTGMFKHFQSLSSRSSTNWHWLFDTCPFTIHPFAKNKHISGTEQSSEPKSILFKPGSLQANRHHPFLPIVSSLSNIILHQNTVSWQSLWRQNHCMDRFYLSICLKKMGLAGVLTIPQNAGHFHVGQTESQWVSDVDEARQNDATGHTIGQGIEWCTLSRRQTHATKVERSRGAWLDVWYRGWNTTRPSI